MHGRDSSYYSLKWAADNMSVTFQAVQTQGRLHINETAFHVQRHLSNIHPRLFLLCPPLSLRRENLVAAGHVTTQNLVVKKSVGWSDEEITPKLHLQQGATLLIMNNRSSNLMSQ